MAETLLEQMRHLMNTEEVEEYTRIPAGTLGHWRWRSKVKGKQYGPPFIRLDKYVLYDRRQVDAWLEETTRQLELPLEAS